MPNRVPTGTSLILPVVLGLVLAAPGCRSSAPTTTPAPAPQGAGPEAEAQAPPSPRDLGAGLLVTDLAPGSGPQCPPDATITMNFVAAFASGHIYDSSEQRKRPLTFSLASPGLIEGLKRGIPGMRPGGKRRIAIPWALAYGVEGREPVPPKTDLVFEVELIEWTPAEPAAARQPAGAARPHQR